MQSKFFLALLTERHGGARAPLNDQSVLVRLAEKCGLDVDKFQSDMEDEELVKIIAEDHTEATEVHGAFGTPTFIFDNGQRDDKYDYGRLYIKPDKVANYYATDGSVVSTLNINYDYLDID